MDGPRMLRPHPAALCEAGPRASDSLQDCCKMPEARWPLQTLDETQQRDAIQASTTWGTQARATTGRPDPVVFNADDAGENILWLLFIYSNSFHS